MPNTFRLSTLDDAERISALASECFRSEEEIPAFSRSAMTWKYWSGQDHESASRGYVLENDDRIAAHCGLMPFQASSKSQSIRVAHFIDWLAAPGTLGAGRGIVRHITGLVDALFAVGGSGDTRRLLPVIGFRPANDCYRLARPLRPIRQAVTHPHRNWKLPARFVRNSLWSLASTVKSPAGWSLHESDPGSVPAEIWRPAYRGTLQRDRSHQVYTHLLGYPLKGFQFFVARKQNEVTGGFLLSIRDGQARIADLWLLDQSDENYEAMYRLAVAAAMKTGAVEVATCASTAVRLKALERCAFRRFACDPIMVLPGERIPSAEIDVQMIDSDSAFLSSGTPDYLT